MIVVNLDVMMAKRKMSLSQLSEKVDITLANLSILKTTRPRPSVSPRWRPSAPPWTASRETFWSSCRTKRRNHDRQAHGSAPPKAGLHLPSPHFPCWRRSSSPAHVLQRRLAGSGIGPPAGVDPCVLLPLVSLGIRLWSRADRGRWDPVYCGTSSADCIRRRSVCRSAPEGRRGRCGIS